MSLRKLAAILALAVAVVIPARIAWSQEAQDKAAGKEAAAAPAPTPAPTPAPEKAVSGTPSGSAADNAPSTNYLRWIFESEGIFFFPQLAMSIILIAMIIMYGMQAQRGEFLPPAFVADFEAQLNEKKYQDAYELAKTNTSLLARVVTAGLVRLSAGGGYPQALESMQEVGEDESMKLDHRLSYLAMLANVATMVGLLGTVWGMVAAFIVISQSDTSPKPSELAKGVSQALVTTVWGLLQAIPAIIGHTILKNRFARLMLEVGIASERLMNRFSTMGAGKKPAAPTPGAGPT